MFRYFAETFGWSRDEILSLPIASVSAYMPPVDEATRISRDPVERAKKRIHRGLTDEQVAEILAAKAEERRRDDI